MNASPPIEHTHTYRDDVGVEHTAELEIVVVGGSPGTYWEPPDPGYVESMTLVIDGEEIADLTGWQWLIDELAAKPAAKPEPDLEEPAP